VNEGVGEWDEVLPLLRLRDRVEEFSALNATGDDPYVIVAPLGWCNDADEAYGMRVVHTAAVDRPFLAFDPRAEMRRDDRRSGS
jgi:hypothetical protein